MQQKNFYISQPALTYRIRELEKELNIKIFIRGKGSVKFTKEGILLIQYANKMLSYLSNLKDQLYDMNQSCTGSIEMVRQGFGYAIIPMNAAQIKNLQDSLYIRSLHHKNGTDHQIDLFAYYRKEVAEIKTVKTFINFLKQYFASQRSI